VLERISRARLQRDELDAELGLLIVRVPKIHPCR
jgi:hypothetical protein